MAAFIKIYGKKPGKYPLFPFGLVQIGLNMVVFNLYKKHAFLRAIFVQTI